MKTLISVAAFSFLLISGAAFADSSDSSSRNMIGDPVNTSTNQR